PTNWTGRPAKSSPHRAEKLDLGHRFRHVMDRRRLVGVGNPPDLFDDPASNQAATNRFDPDRRTTDVLPINSRRRANSAFS
ncbi:MAG: hypothetical protein ACRC1K_14815, partial [Planctomycetia bacterium]